MKPGDPFYTSHPEWLLGHCLLLRMAAVSEVGLGDERIWAYGDEVSLCLRVMQRRWRIALAQGALVANTGEPSMDSALVSFLTARNSILLAHDFGGWARAWGRAAVVLLRAARWLLPHRGRAIGFQSPREPPSPALLRLHEGDGAPPRIVLPVASVAMRPIVSGPRSSLPSSIVAGGRNVLWGRKSTAPMASRCACASSTPMGQGCAGIMAGVPTFIAQALKGKSRPFMATERGTRSHIYVDIHRGCLALDRRGPHRPVNLGNPTEIGAEARGDVSPRS